MEPTAERSAQGYGWQHAAFGIGVAALVFSCAAGLLHAARQGRLPAPSLDPYAEVQALESRGEWKQALRRYEALAQITPGDAQPWRKVAEIAARVGDRDAESRARREIARHERRRADAGASR